MKNFFLKNCFYALFGVLFILSSCNRGINGKIIDNFNKPVENVDIKIKNSAFQAKSSSNGNFSIDYVAGSIIVEFSKEGYLPMEKELQISQKLDYPLGQIDMVRIPKTKEVFIKGDDDFVRIPMVMMDSKCKTLAGSFGLPYNQCIYSLPKDRFLVYKTDSITNFTIYAAFDKPLALLKMGNDNYVSTYTYGNTIPGQVDGLPVESKGRNLGNVVSEIKFVPEYDKVYVFIILEKKSLTVTTSSIAFAFKIVKKNN